MSKVTDLDSRRPKPPAPPMIDGETEHLFEYHNAAGVLKGISVWGKDEADARDHLRRAADGAFVGICHAKIPL